MKECVYLAMAAIETGKDFLVIITVTAKRKRYFIKNVKSCGCKLLLKKLIVLALVREKMS